MRESAESTLAPGVLSYCENLEGRFDDAKAHSHGIYYRAYVLREWAFDTLTCDQPVDGGRNPHARRQLK